MKIDEKFVVEIIKKHIDLIGETDLGDETSDFGAYTFYVTDYENEVGVSFTNLKTKEEANFNIRVTKTS